MFGLFDLDKWQEIWNTIAANKTRSIMTGFGVFWGIFMLTILMGIGNSFEGGILKQIDGFATNSCFFFTNVTSEPYKGYRKGRYWQMNFKDIKVIKDKATALENISPMLFGASSSKNVVLGRKSASAQVMGVSPDFFNIQTQTVLKGRLFNEIDVETNRKVALIGKTIAENLYNANENPIGTQVRVNGIYFQVVGVIQPNSQAQIGGDALTSVYIPMSTMQRAFNMGDKIYFMAATAKNGYDVSILENQITEILKKNHEIAPNDEKAVRSFNVEKEFKTFDFLFQGIRFIIWFVGLGSLLSGIIGVSNIMLVTVSERTREIGIRRALGAKPTTILNQIMSESFVLTFIAGFSGLFIGLVLLQGMSAIINSAGDDVFFIAPTIAFSTAVGAMIILMFAGLLAGFIPSARALNIKAIDAIRDE